jgi:hypothetical protein
MPASVRVARWPSWSHWTVCSVPVGVEVVRVRVLPAVAVLNHQVRITRQAATEHHLEIWLRLRRFDGSFMTSAADHGAPTGAVPTFGV